MHAFMRDWHRWTLAERLVAVALLGILLGLLFALLVITRGAL